MCPVVICSVFKPFLVYRSGIQLISLQSSEYQTSVQMSPEFLICEYRNSKSGIEMILVFGHPVSRFLIFILVCSFKNIE